MSILSLIDVLCSGVQVFDEGLCADIMSCVPKDVTVLYGKTMTCDDFYEGQGRLDGAVCAYSEEVCRVWCGGVWCGAVWCGVM